MYSLLGMCASFYHGCRQDVDTLHDTEIKLKITKAHEMGDTYVCKCRTQLLTFVLTSVLAHFKKQKDDLDKWNCCRAERFSLDRKSVV
jgi:hypothetical protein